MLNRPIPQPAKNLAQAIIDIAVLLKDPTWMAAAAQTAKDVAEANKLTEEEAQKLDAAKQILEAACDTEKNIAEKLDALKKGQQDLEAAKQSMANRERQCDTRNGQLAALETRLGGQAKKLAEDTVALVSAQGRLAEGKEYLLAGEQAVIDRESAVKKREDALQQAAGVISRAQE